MSVGTGPSVTLDVTAAGKLAWTPGARRAVDMLLLTLAGKRVDIDIVEHEDTRSVKANAYYWGCVVTPCVEHTGDSKEDFHDEMCLRFLTRRQIAIVNRSTGEAEEFVLPGRSSKLKISDFYDFVEEVRRFAAEFLSVVTEDPDPAYWRKRRAA